MSSEVGQVFSQGYENLSEYEHEEEVRRKGNGKESDRWLLSSKRRGGNLICSVVVASREAVQWDRGRAPRLNIWVAPGKILCT